MAVKFTPEEKADIANSIDDGIKLRMRAVATARDAAVKLAHQQGVDRLRELFIKVRQEL